MFPAILRDYCTIFCYSVVCAAELHHGFDTGIGLELLFRKTFRTLLRVAGTFLHENPPHQSAKLSDLLDKSSSQSISCNISRYFFQRPLHQKDLLASHQTAANITPQKGAYNSSNAAQCTVPDCTIIVDPRCVECEVSPQRRRKFFHIEKWELWGLQEPKKPKKAVFLACHFWQLKLFQVFEVRAGLLCGHGRGSCGDPLACGDYVCLSGSSWTIFSNQLQ